MSEIKIPVDYATNDLRVGYASGTDKVFVNLKNINEQIYNEAQIAINKNPEDEIFITTSSFQFICVILISRDYDTSTLTYIDTYNDEKYARSIFSKMRESTPDRAVMFLKTFYEMQSVYTRLSEISELVPVSFID